LSVSLSNSSCHVFFNSFICSSDIGSNINPLLCLLASTCLIKYSFLLAKSLFTLSSHIEFKANMIVRIIHMLFTLPYNVFTNAKHCSCPQYLSSAWSLLSTIVGTLMIKYLIASSGVSSASIYSTSTFFLLNASFTSGHFVQCDVVNIYNLLI